MLKLVFTILLLWHITTPFPWKHLINHQTFYWFKVVISYKKTTGLAENYCTLLINKPSAWSNVICLIIMNTSFSLIEKDSLQKQNDEMVRPINIYSSHWLIEINSNTRVPHGNYQSQNTVQILQMNTQNLQYIGIYAIFT